MKLNKMRELLDNNLPTVNTRIWTTWPTMVEAAASTGNFDYFEFLAEYAPFELSDLENFARTCELYNTGSMIKVDFQNRFYIAQKALASGFQAVLFTDHKTADEVRETLTNISPDTPENGGRFGYPNGRWINYHPHLSQMDYAQMNRSAVKAFMIEKKEAMDNIEEICSVPGVDMVQFGPSDYCMSLGWNCADHEEELMAAEEKMIWVALAHGVHPRCEIDTPEEAEAFRKLGVRHFCVGDQMKILIGYWNGVCGQVKKLTGSIV